MFKEGTPFKGVLYGGFMLTDSGPKLLEFNTRFGDPECQPLMALLQEDPAPWFLGAACGQLPEGSPRFKAGFAACVVVCSKDYPAKSSPAPILSIPENTSDCLVFHSGTRLENGQLFASGGRVLGITGLGSSLEEALKAAYQGAKAVVFEGASYRSDIGRT
jgi:phosphoribosylamine--glycine ligase